MVLKMLEDKTLIITKMGNTYQGENNAEIIKIILPRLLNDTDITDCQIYLHFLNKQNYGNKVEITESLSVLDEKHYVAQFPVTEILTEEAGNIDIWLSILYSSEDRSVLAKTNSITYTVKSHFQIADDISDDIIYF